MEQKLESLLTWAKQNDAIIDSRVNLLLSSDLGLLAKASDDISASKIFEVPSSICLGPDLARSIFEHHLKDKSYYDGGDELTTLLISKFKFDKLCEHGFGPYIDILPDRLNVPFYWNHQEQSLVEDTDLKIILNRNLQKLVEDWHAVVGSLTYQEEHSSFEAEFKADLKFYEDYHAGRYDGDRLYEYLNKEIHSWTSFSAYVWAHSILTSRGFPYLLVAEDISKHNLTKACLIPLFDILNHKSNSPIKWTPAKESENNKVIFKLEKEAKKGEQLFNNYGDKSNCELLLGYGFAEEKNPHDLASITLKIDDENIFKKALAHGVEFFDGETKVKDIGSLIKGVNFQISNESLLPLNLIDFFAFIVQMKFEENIGLTLRMKLEAVAQVMNILENKVSLFKKNIPQIDGVNIQRWKYVKIYRNGQRVLYQKSLEKVLSLEKNMLKKYKTGIFAFKSLLKIDRGFAAAVTKGLRLKSDEDITGLNMDDILLLWLVRVYNKDASPNNFFLASSEYGALISLILTQFNEVKSSIEIDDADRLDYKKFYSSYFPEIAKRSPEVFGKGKWDLDTFIIADTVVDRIVYRRPVNQELLFTSITKIDE